jgi:hypothetical protein
MDEHGVYIYVYLYIIYTLNPGFSGQFSHQPGTPFRGLLRFSRDTTVANRSTKNGESSGENVAL